GSSYTFDFRTDADPGSVPAPDPRPDYHIRAFKEQMRKMIVESDDTSAGICIQGLGYSWINACLQKAGLFDGKSSGIWLAGDYVGDFPDIEKDIKLVPYLMIRINSV